MDFVKGVFVKKGEAAMPAQAQGDKKRGSGMTPEEEKAASMHYFAPADVRNKYINKRLKDEGAD